MLLKCRNHHAAAAAQAAQAVATDRFLQFLQSTPGFLPGVFVFKQDQPGKNGFKPESSNARFPAQDGESDFPGGGRTVMTFLPSFVAQAAVIIELLPAAA